MEGRVGDTPPPPRTAATPSLEFRFGRRVGLVVALKVCCSAAARAGVVRRCCGVKTPEPWDWVRPPVDRAKLFMGATRRVGCIRAESERTNLPYESERMYTRRNSHRITIKKRITAQGNHIGVKDAQRYTSCLLHRRASSRRLETLPLGFEFLHSLPDPRNLLCPRFCQSPYEFNTLLCIA